LRCAAASSAVADEPRGGSAAAREGQIVAVARKKVVESATGGVGGTSQPHAVAEWAEPNWAALQLGKPDAAPWPFKILFDGVNSNKDHDLCLKEELEKIQAALDKGFSRASTDRPVLKHIAVALRLEVRANVRGRAAGERERETLLGNRVQKVAPVWQGRERQHKINTKTTQRQRSSVWCLSTDCYSLLVISVTQTLSS
jgi:hypothetical protein